MFWSLYRNIETFSDANCSLYFFQEVIAAQSQHVMSKFMIKKNKHVDVHRVSCLSLRSRLVNKSKCLIPLLRTKAAKSSRSLQLSLSVRLLVAQKEIQMMDHGDLGFSYQMVNQCLSCKTNIIIYFLWAFILFVQLFVLLHFLISITCCKCFIYSSWHYKSKNCLVVFKFTLNTVTLHDIISENLFLFLTLNCRTFPSATLWCSCSGVMQ